MPVPEVVLIKILYQNSFSLKIQQESHQLKLSGLGIKGDISLNVDDLKKKYEQVDVVSAIQW